MKTQKIKIALDPGHGGIDRSNVGPTGYVEADGVLDISKRVAANLTALSDFEVLLTRNIDKTISLLDRIKLGEEFGADMFISFHTDAFSTPDVGGTTVFYSVARPKSKAFAESLSSAISSHFNISNRGARIRLNKSNTDYYGILRYGSNAGIQNVFIFESMFHSNPTEEKLLKQPEVRQQIADITTEQICKFYNVPYHKEGNMTLEEKVNILWKEVFGEEPEQPKPTYPVLVRGQKGEEVGKLQNKLNLHGANLSIDNSFGPATYNAVVTFQNKVDLPADGVVNAATWEKLNADPKPSAPARPLLEYRDRGEDVKLLQALLNKDGYALEVDGSFGPGTLRAVNSFQKRYNLQIKDTIDLSMWQKLEEVASGKKSIYSKLRRFSTDIHVLELPQDLYHVDFEVGQLGKHERPSTMANNILKQGKDVIAAVNLGFFVFGSTIEHLGSWIDEGIYYYPPKAEFIDTIYHRDGKLEVHNYDGYDGKFLSGLQKTAYWMAGLSYSVVQDGKINLENSSKYSHSKSRHPRTLIGQKENGNMLLVVADGRSKTSLGLTAQQSAEVMMELGAINAVNADGGGSSSMSIFDGEKVRLKSKPSDGNERAVGSCLMVYRK